MLECFCRAWKCSGRPGDGVKDPSPWSAGLMGHRTEGMEVPWSCCHQKPPTWVQGTAENLVSLHPRAVPAAPHPPQHQPGTPVQPPGTLGTLGTAIPQTLSCTASLELLPWQRLGAPKSQVELPLLFSSPMEMNFRPFPLFKEAANEMYGAEFQPRYGWE